MPHAQTVERLNYLENLGPFYQTPYTIRIHNARINFRHVKFDQNSI